MIPITTVVTPKAFINRAYYENKGIAEEQGIYSNQTFI